LSLKSKEAQLLFQRLGQRRVSSGGQATIFESLFEFAVLE